MLIYIFDGETKEFLYSEEAERDYMETMRLGHFVPSVPGFATLEEPPVSKKGYCLVYQGKWEYKEDHRGEHVINKENEEEEIVNYIGELKPGYVNYDEYINSSEYKQKQLKIEREIKYQEALEGATNYINTTTYCGIEASDANIGKLGVYMMGFQQGLYTEVAWTTKDDMVITLSEEGVVDVLKHLAEIQATTWNIKFVNYAELIKSANTIEEIQNIIINYGD